MGYHSQVKGGGELHHMRNGWDTFGVTALSSLPSLFHFSSCFFPFCLVLSSIFCCSFFICLLSLPLTYFNLSVFFNYFHFQHLEQTLILGILATSAFPPHCSNWTAKRCNSNSQWNNHFVVLQDSGSQLFRSIFVVLVSVGHKDNG